MGHFSRWSRSAIRPIHLCCSAILLCTYISPCPLPRHLLRFACIGRKALHPSSYFLPLGMPLCILGNAWLCCKNIRLLTIANILRNCTAQMNRSVEILQILRRWHGDYAPKCRAFQRPLYSRIFNFDEKRVGLRMEVSENGQAFLPMGRIDVLELPTNNGRVTCSCTLTELQTGNTQRVVLRLKE